MIRSALMSTCSALFLFFRSLLVSRISLATEVLVLRQQLLVLNRTFKRPKLLRSDRLFWLCLSRLWSGWREVLSIVKPHTVILRGFGEGHLAIERHLAKRTFVAACKAAPLWIGDCHCLAEDKSERLCLAWLPKSCEDSGA